MRDVFCLFTYWGNVICNPNSSFYVKQDLCEPEVCVYASSEACLREEMGPNIQSFAVLNENVVRLIGQFDEMEYIR